MWGDPVSPHSRPREDLAHPPLAEESCARVPRALPAGGAGLHAGVQGNPVFPSPHPVGACGRAQPSLRNLLRFMPLVGAEAE